MIKEQTGSKRTTKREARDELAAELRHLRTMVREVGENFILRQEGEIETTISHLDSLPSGKLRLVANSLLQDIRKLKVKPAKGRFKDLKEFNRLIEDLTHQVMSAQEKGKRPAKR
jgi:deoxyribose-phosphate aldolase